MTHLECACTKKKKPSSIGRTVWTPWRKSVTWQKPVPHSINSRLEDTKAEKKKDKLKPKWEGPFIIDQVLTGGVYRLRNASDNRLEPNPWNAARL